MSERNRGQRESVFVLPLITLQWPRWPGLNQAKPGACESPMCIARVQVIALYSVAFPGAYTGSWIRSGTGCIKPLSNVLAFPYRCWFKPQLPQDSPEACASDIHMRSLEEASGSWLWPGLAPAVAASGE